MKLKLLFTFLLAAVMQWGVAWADGPEMNVPYSVTLSFPDWNNEQIPGASFNPDALSAKIKVTGCSYIAFARYYNYKINDIEEFAYSDSNKAGIYYNISGELLEDAKLGKLYVRTGTNTNPTLTVTSYATADGAENDNSGSTPGSGGGTEPGGNDEPGYEPDYTYQRDLNDDGVLEPCAEYPAFGVKIDYNKYPQKTNLPTIYITTEETLDYEYKTSTYYTSSIVVVDKNGNMKQRNESVGLRGRGNSTWRSSKKKPWRLKFPEKTKFLAEQDENYVAINNYANAKSWTLLANDFDKSLIRNALTHELVDYVNSVDGANNLPFVPAYRFVDLVLNGEYWGTYQVSDQVQVDKNRINIDDNGWFVEYTINSNGFVEEPFLKIGSSYVNIKNPEDPDVPSGDPNSTAAVGDNQQTTNAMFDEMKATLNALHTAIANKKYVGEDNWRTYVDLPSLIDWVIAMDITGNYDGGIANDYIYKSSTDTKLHFGPLWDLDLAYGNYDDTMTEGKHFWKGNGHEYSGIAGSMDNIYEDKFFVKALYERWQKIYNEGALSTYLLGKVTYLKGIVNESQALNYSEAGHKASQWWTDKWSLSSNGLGGKTYSNYDDAIATITSFIEKHTAWLDGEYKHQYDVLECANIQPCDAGHTYTTKYQDNGDGTHSHVCDVCGTVKSENIAHHTGTYALQKNGSYRKGCDLCGHLDETDSDVYYQFTVYPESKSSEQVMATSWEPSAEKPNSIAVVEAKQEVVEQIAGWNIVAGKKNAAGDLTCHDFRLTDGHPYYSENKFVATNASYTRNITSNIGTICLPFKQQNAVIYNGMDKVVSFYHLKSIDSEEMVLTPIQPEIEGNASAYYPVVFVAEEGVTSFTVTGKDITVKKSSADKINSTFEGWTLVGTMEKQVIDNASVLKDELGNDQHLYYFSGGKFYRATGKYTNNPFRAYFLSNENIFAPGVSQAPMRILAEEGTTGIERIISEPTSNANHGVVEVSRLLLPLPEGRYNIRGKEVLVK